MIRFVTLLILVAANTAVATPMPSREKPNALGFHQHQPKSSLHNYTFPTQVAEPSSASDDASNSAPATGPGAIAPVGKLSGSPPALGPGRIAPVDKPTIATTTTGPGRMTPPVDKTKTSPPEGCLSQRMGDENSVPWGCALRKPPKQIPEPETYALLAMGLIALWWARVAHRRRLPRRASARG